MVGVGRVSYLSLMRFQMTIRYGTQRQRYHTLEVQASDVREALLAGADAVPEEVLPEADLVEIRVAPKPDEREYVE